MLSSTSDRFRFGGAGNGLSEYRVRYTVAVQTSGWQQPFRGPPRQEVIDSVIREVGSGSMAGYIYRVGVNLLVLGFGSAFLRLNRGKFNGGSFDWAEWEQTRRRKQHTWLGDLKNDGLSF